MYFEICMLATNKWCQRWNIDVHLCMLTPNSLRYVCLLYWPLSIFLLTYLFGHVLRGAHSQDAMQDLGMYHCFFLLNWSQKRASTKCIPENSWLEDCFNVSKGLFSGPILVFRIFFFQVLFPRFLLSPNMFCPSPPKKKRKKLRELN